MARPREFQEGPVVAAALERFSSHGYAGTSVQDLCEATGVGRSSLYGAFGDKHDLYLQAFRRYCDDSLDNLRDELEGPATGALSRLISHIERKAANATHDQRGCFLANATSELGEHDPAVARLAHVTMDGYGQLIEQCIRQAQSCGDIEPGRDPSALGTSMLVTLRGIEALSKTGRTRAFMRTAAEAAIALLVTPAPDAAPLDGS